MKEKTILIDAINIAIHNGYNKLEGLNTVGLTIDSYADLALKEPHALLFDHDFAKALWDKNFIGTNTPATYQYNLDDIPAWKHHLMQMVTSDYPIKYLGDNINN